MPIPPQGQVPIEHRPLPAVSPSQHVPVSERQSVIVVFIQTFNYNYIVLYRSAQLRLKDGMVHTYGPNLRSGTKGGSMSLEKSCDRYKELAAEYFQEVCQKSTDFEQIGECLSTLLPRDAFSAMNTMLLGM